MAQISEANIPVDEKMQAERDAMVRRNAAKYERRLRWQGWLSSVAGVVLGLVFFPFYVMLVHGWEAAAPVAAIVAEDIKWLVTFGGAF
ncbi:MAG: hypothetical protein ACR2OV_03445 [Hyphomicrobiaceae bacterium]